MAGATFMITELNTLGGAPPPGGYQKFEWDEAHRSIPEKPWSAGVHQRTKRTDYPGADDPTEQVLGPNFTPFTLRGSWDDRYNSYGVSDEIIRTGTPGEIRELSGGYAVQERDRFKEMVRRGNLARISFEQETFVGIITDFDWDYFHRALIGYSFTVSPHHQQPGGYFALKRSPRSVLNVQQLRSEVGAELDEALTVHARAPEHSLVGTIFLDAEAIVGDWTAALTEIDTAIEQRQLTPELEPTASLLRLAQQFYTMGTIGVDVLDLLHATDADEALNYESGGRTILYDYWARGLMYHARRMVVVGRRAAAELQQRAEPNALGLYTPQAGEHLYKISTSFYGTADHWRAIAKRNGLDSYTLTGEELLIIPEVNER